MIFNKKRRDWPIQFTPPTTNSSYALVGSFLSPSLRYRWLYSERRKDRESIILLSSLTWNVRKCRSFGKLKVINRFYRVAIGPDQNFIYFYLFVRKIDDLRNDVAIEKIESMFTLYIYLCVCACVCFLIFLLLIRFNCREITSEIIFLRNENTSGISSKEEKETVSEEECCREGRFDEKWKREEKCCQRKNYENGF